MAAYRTQNRIQKGRVIVCNPRKLTRREMLGFPKWKRELEAEDVRKVGSVVKRPLSVLHDIYRIYLDYGKGE